MTPIVAIVGRPNVGKSTLFNRWVGRRAAIVHDAPGVTRDRHYADTHVHGRDLTLVDTGGFDPESDDPMGKGIARQVQAAISEADVVICVLDAMAPVHSADEQAVRLLRRSKKPVLFVANRVDNPELLTQSLELYRLGIDPIFAISALHGTGTAELEAALVRALPERIPEQPEASGKIPRVALVGRPNAGKSSLLNALAGSERSLVDSRPGTTRDPIDVELEFQGKKYLVVDTAGIRRKARIQEDVESASVMRAIRAVERADIAMLVLDASIPISEQDQRLLGLCIERGKAIVVALNKCDLLSKTERDRAIQATREALAFAHWAKVLTLSAKTKSGLGSLMRSVSKIYEQYSRRIATAELNRFFEEILARNPPPTHRGRAPRLYYVTQARSAPPLFAAMCSSAVSLKESYKRFVSNQIRERFGFDSVPVIVRFRERRRREQ